MTEPSVATTPITQRGMLPVVLLIVGLGLVISSQTLAPDVKTAVQYGAATSVVAVALVPAINRRIRNVLARLAKPSPKTMALTQLVLTAMSAWYFLHTAQSQSRLLEPKMHDEYMYAIQTRMVAGGHLWLPQHPLADFFETFYVLVRPVYAPIYFPGTALMFAGAVWLGLSFWAWAVLVAGAIVGMSYRVFTELFDGVAGLLAALLMLALPLLHFVSIMIMSHTAFLLLALCLIWICLRWHRQPRWGWTLAAGVVVGWMAITRPLDALCVALPLGVPVVIRLWRQPARQSLFTLAILGGGAAPFLGLQLAFDRAVTGHLLQTPVALYTQKYWPSASMGFQPADPTFRPPTPLPQFQELYHWFMLREIDDHAAAGFFGTLAFKMRRKLLALGFASAGLLLLVPLGFTALRRSHWMIVSALPLFLVSYAFYPFLLDHYLLTVAPALITLVLAGLAAIRAWSDFLYPTAALLILTLALTSVHELNPGVHDADLPAEFVLHVEMKLDEIKEPAIVLFKYAGHSNFHEEPVYNTDVANPDDAPIIRAHDLGSRNIKLFRYYARLAPDRAVYRYDRNTLSFDRLGTVAELAR